LNHDLETYGLVLLFVLVAIEGCGVPLPGETALAAAAVLAASGHFDIVAVIAVGATAAIIGDNTGYWIARLGGRALLERLPVVRDTLPRLLPRSERFFERYGAAAVLGARFFAGFRITAAWLAGISHMRWLRFVIFNAIGGTLWAVLVGMVSFEFGRAVETAVSDDGLIALVVVLGVGICVVSAVYLWRRRRRRLAAKDAGFELTPR